MTLTKSSPTLRIRSVGEELLEKPLITPRQLKHYLSETYGITKNIKKFVNANPEISTIKLEHKFNSLPHVLYHDQKRNRGTITSWDIMLLPKNWTLPRLDW